MNNFTKLEYISLSGNSLNGTIPDSIGNWISVAYISFANNKLTGSIPDTIGNLKNGLLIPF